MNALLHKIIKSFLHIVNIPDNHIAWSHCSLVNVFEIVRLLWTKLPQFVRRLGHSTRDEFAIGLLFLSLWFDILYQFHQSAIVEWISRLLIFLEVFATFCVNIVLSLIKLKIQYFKYNYELNAVTLIQSPISRKYFTEGWGEGTFPFVWNDSRYSVRLSTSAVTKLVSWTFSSLFR